MRVVTFRLRFKSQGIVLLIGVMVCYVCWLEHGSNRLIVRAICGCSIISSCQSCSHFLSFFGLAIGYLKVSEEIFGSCYSLDAVPDSQLTVAKH